ncbi:hypothetical protein [Rhodohalobacter sp. 8-1]|uniref:hypothetical protein n=1 Tax=Rhodohalobacter sp. 8-1 TaxID=3131972 RepID=UPI0030EDBFDF
MNDAYLHLVINHLPVFSMLFGLLILIWGLIKSNTAIKKLAMVLFIVGAVGSYAAVETGEGAEDIIEDFAPSISHDLIHDHEEAAEIAMWFSYVTGGLALLALFTTGKNVRYEKVLTGVLFIAALAAVGMLMYTAYEGGKIRHPEAHETAVMMIPSDDIINEIDIKAQSHHG